MFALEFGKLATHLPLLQPLDRLGEVGDKERLYVGIGFQQGKIHFRILLHKVYEDDHTAEDNHIGNGFAGYRLRRLLLLVTLVSVAHRR